MPVNPFTRALRGAIEFLTLACGWWFIALSVATCVEMVSRKLFNYSLQGIDEIGAYTLAVTSAIGFSYALLLKAHTRVDFLVSKLPVGLRAFLNLAAMVTLAAMALFAVYRGWVVPAESVEFQSVSTSPLQTPLWIPHSLWFLGWALFALCAAILAAHAGLLFVRDKRALNKTYGPLTLEEEIEAEAGEILHPAGTNAPAPARGERRS
jgi:TRAP-type C4-dicarboxylate transport system permease small subunit